MKAAVLYEPGQPLRVEDVQLSPPQAGEVLVRVGAAGVCHSDYHVMHGDMAAPLPAVLDHEGAGVVEQVAPGVTSVAPGDHVVLLWRTSCGHCEYCSVGRPALCPVGTVMRRQRAPARRHQPAAPRRPGDPALRWRVVLRRAHGLRPAGGTEDPGGRTDAHRGRRRLRSDDRRRRRRQYGHGGARLEGSIYGSTRPQADFPRLFELYRRGRLSLDRINEAYDTLLAGTVARSVIVP